MDRQSHTITLYTSQTETVLQVLERDEKVRPDAFGQDLTRQQFVAFVFSGLMAGLAREDTDCAVLLAVIRRVLY